MTNKDKNNLINKKYCIAGFYHFSEILNLEGLQISIKEITYKLRLLGTILIANEGINGTISGEKNSIDIFFKSLTKFSMFKNIEKKISFDDKPGFKRMKVRLKKEIVKMGKTNISPKDKVGKYVKKTTFQRTTPLIIRFFSKARACPSIWCDDLCAICLN